jgi:hypothetical protein
MLRRRLILWGLLFSLLALPLNAIPKYQIIHFLMSGTHKSNGSVNAMGKVYIYQDSGKTAFKTVYNNADGTGTPLSMPLTLDVKGAYTGAYTDGSCYIEVKDRYGVTIDTFTQPNFTSYVSFGGMVVDVLGQYGSVADGVLSDGIDKAIADCTSNIQYEFWFKGGDQDYIFSSTTTFPSNITCVFFPGAHLTNSGTLTFDGGVLDFGQGSYITNTGTLTFDGAYIKAGAYQIIANTGTISGYVNTLPILTEWFGAKGDGIVDCHLPISYALDLVPSAGATIEFGIGTYLTTGGWEVPAYTVICGQGRSVTEIKVKAGVTSANFLANCNAVFYINGGASTGGEIVSRYITFKDISLNGNDTDNAAIPYDGIRYRRTQYSGIEQCEIRSFPRSGVVYAYHSGDVDVNTSLWMYHTLVRDSDGPQIVIEKTYNLDIMDGTIRTGSDAGIVFQNEASDRTRIKNIQFNQTGKQAIVTVSGNSSTAVQVGECEFYSSCYYTTLNAAIDINGGSGWQINNNYFENNLGWDIYSDNNYAQINNNKSFQARRGFLWIPTGSRSQQVCLNEVKNCSLVDTANSSAFLIEGDSNQLIGNKAINTATTWQMKYGIELGVSADSNYIGMSEVGDSGISGNISESNTNNYLVENNGIGQDAAFSVKLTGSVLNFPVGGHVVVTFNNEHYDNHSDYNAVSCNFTAPFKGLYPLRATLRAQEVPSTNYEMSIVIMDEAGVTVDEIVAQYDARLSGATLTYYPMTVGDVVLMQKGWTAHVCYYQEAGAATVDLDDNSTFTGYYLKDDR